VRRLHPSALLFDAGRRLFALVSWAVAVLFFAARSDEGWFLLFLVPPFLQALIRYVSFRYAFEAAELVVREGWLFRSVRHVPYARIANLDTVQGPLHRFLGVVEVRLETAGGSEPEAVFRVITLEQLAELRARVFGPRAAARTADEAFARAEGGHGAALFRMGTGDVLLYGLLTQRGLVLVGGALVALHELGDLERLRERLGPGLEQASEEAAGLPPWIWALVVLALLVLLQLGSALWAYLTLFGFRLERQGEDLRTTCGLLTRQTASLPRARIQRLELRQGWLARLLRRVSLRAVSAGGDSTRDTQVARKWLVPLCRPAEVPGLLAEIQPEARFDGADWRGVHPRAARRLALRAALPCVPLVALVGLASWSAAAGVAVLGVAYAAWAGWRRARLLGWALEPGAVLVRDGLLGRRAACVRFEKIQALDLRRSPFDRWARMAHLAVDTAGAAGSGRFLIPFLPLRVALRLRRRLARAAAQATFRW